ncbi:hypothetical protein D3C86_1235480 [compost metagenome]
MAQADRDRILEVGPARLDDPVELDGLAAQHALQLFERRVQHLGELEGRQAHGGRDHVVGGLALVDVVVGVDRGVGAQLLAHQEVGAVGDHLVHVHVQRGARPRLEGIHHDLLVPLAVAYLLGGAVDGVRLLGREHAKRSEDAGRRLLDDRQRVDHGRIRAQAADRIVLDRALGLNAPVGVLRHGDRPQRVPLDAAFLGHGHGSTLRSSSPFGLAPQYSNMRARRDATSDEIRYHGQRKSLCDNALSSLRKRLSIERNPDRQPYRRTARQRRQEPA